MSFLHARRRGGRGTTATVVAADEGLLQPALELVLEGLDSGRRAAGPHLLDDRQGYLKGGPLRAHSALRHTARRLLLGRPIPRLAELENLRWLRSRLFQAPAPLAAGVGRRRGLPVWQFLVTAEVPAAETLEDFLLAAAADEAPADRDAGRAAVVTELARELGRMHALGFVHRDLYPRNVLVGPTSLPRRLFFLDAWAGGARIQRRGVAHDLACLFLEGAELLSAPEQRSWFESYLAERRAQNRPVDARRLGAAITRARSRLRRQLVAQPARRRGRALPLDDWQPPI